MTTNRPAQKGALTCPLCGGEMRPPPTAGVHECSNCRAMLLHGPANRMPAWPTIEPEDPEHLKP